MSGVKITTSKRVKRLKKIKTILDKGKTTAGSTLFTRELGNAKFGPMAGPDNMGVFLKEGKFCYWNNKYEPNEKLAKAMWDRSSTSKCEIEEDHHVEEIEPNVNVDKLHKALQKIAGVLSEVLVKQEDFGESLDSMKSFAVDIKADIKKLKET